MTILLRQIFGSISLFGAFDVSPTLGAIVTCSHRVLFGRSGFWPDSNVIIGISAASIGLPGPKYQSTKSTKNQISHSWIMCTVDRWIWVERNLKMLRPFRSFRPPKRDDYPVYKGAIFGILSLCVNVINFGGYPKTSSGCSDFTRRLRPAFSVSTGLWFLYWTSALSSYRPSLTRLFRQTE